MSKQLTITDLLKRKEEFKNKKVKKATLHVESIDAEITIQAPDRALAIELIAMAQDNSERADAYACLKCVVSPNLQDAKLQEGFGCAEPTDIVKHIFLPGEVSQISLAAMKLAGYGSGVTKVVEDLKN